jgi:GT2 family glycosyltransferase
MSIELSIAIVNWNTRKYLIECLESIRANLQGISYEVIVADNGSIDASPETVKKSFPWVELIENKQNLGFAQANNQIFEKARSGYFLILNPDVLITPTALNQMKRFLDDNPGCAAVSPKYINPDGSFQRFYRRWPGPEVFLVHLTKFLRLAPRWSKRIMDGYYYRLPEDDFSRDFELVQPGASCLMVRSCLFNGAPLFDQRFPIFFNDVDLCQRIRKKGYTVFYLAQAQVIHHLGKGRELDRMAEEKDYILSWIRYLRKYHRISAELVKAVIVCEFAVLTAVNAFSVLMGKKSGADYRANIRYRLDIIFEKGGFKLGPVNFHS